MRYEFDVVEVEAVTLAVAEAVVPVSEVPQHILGLFDAAYAWLAQSELDQTGHNYALYRPAAEGLRMQAGFPVSERFEDTESVACVELDAGRAAHTIHQGDYGGLRDANAQLYSWCGQQEHVLGGLSWEVYGDWHDDPAQLVTELYVRIA